MPTCPNCGSIVMNGDPYCNHCGTVFKWENDEPDNLEMILKKRMDDAFNDPNNLYLVYLMYANEEFEKGNYLNAANAADESIKLNPNEDVAWAIKRESLIRLGIDDKTFDTAKQEILKNQNSKITSQNDNLNDNNVLDKKMENLKELYNHINHNVSIESSVKFKVCENCGKKINIVAKKCPYCNVTLSEDNTILIENTVLYCSNCHKEYHDSNFCMICGKKLVSKSEYDEIIKKQKQFENKKICPKCSKERNPEDNYCIDCGEKLISGLEYKNILKTIPNSQRQPKVMENNGFKTCPKCKKIIPKNAIRCKYCKTMLKKY